MALTLLTWLLRLGGTLLGLAAFAVVMPRETLATTNAWLGLGPLPDAPITYYLARSTSAQYALRGALLWLASTDLVRYRSLIVLLAVTNILFGVVMLVVDATAGMPWWWTAFEGPGIVAIGIVVLRLVRSVPSSR